MHQKRLGDMASYVNGYAFKPEQRGKVGLPIIRIQDLTGNVYDLGFYDGDYPKKVEINDGDVLISWSASLGVYEWNRGKALLNQHIFKVVFDKLTVDKKFFMYAVKYKLEEMESKAHGATMKHITKKDFDNTVISFPTIVEQERISNTLNKLHTIIDSKKFQLEKLDNLIKARFVEMFGDVVANDKNWSTEPISKVAPTNSPKIKINEMVWLLNLDMVESQSGKVIDKIIVSEDKINASTCAFDEKNVLYSKLRPYLNKVVLPDQGGYCTTELVPLKPGEKITREFLAALLRTDAFVGYINEKTAGTKMPRVSMNVFKQFECILPPIALQQQFSEFYKQVDKSKFTLQNSIISLMNLWYNINQYVCERTYGEA